MRKRIADVRLADSAPACPKCGGLGFTAEPGKLYDSKTCSCTAHSASVPCGCRIGECAGAGKPPGAVCRMTEEIGTDAQ